MFLHWDEEYRCYFGKKEDTFIAFMTEVVSDFLQSIFGFAVRTNSGDFERDFLLLFFEHCVSLLRILYQRGGQRSQLVRQFLGESIITAVISLFIAMIIYRRSKWRRLPAGISLERKEQIPRRPLSFWRSLLLYCFYQLSTACKKRFNTSNARCMYLEHSPEPGYDSCCRISPPRLRRFRALFSVYALLEAPETFNSYIARSPMIGHSPDYIKSKAEVFVNKAAVSNGILYMIYGSDDRPRVTDYVPDFHDYLKSNASKDFVSELVILEGEGHVPQSSLIRALQFIFSQSQTVTLPSLTNKFKMIYFEKMNYDVPLIENMLCCFLNLFKEGGFEVRMDLKIH